MTPPPIRKPPRQGSRKGQYVKDVHRHIDISAYPHKAIQDQKRRYPQNPEKWYMEFPYEAPSRERNRKALQTCGRVLEQVLGDDYGKKTVTSIPWNTMKEILGELSEIELMRVYQQGEDNWMLRDFVQRKLASKIKVEKKKAGKEGFGSRGELENVLSAATGSRQEEQNDNDRPNTAEAAGNARAAFESASVAPACNFAPDLNEENQPEQESAFIVRTIPRTNSGSVRLRTEKPFAEYDDDGDAIVEEPPQTPDRSPVNKKQNSLSNPVLSTSAMAAEIASLRAIISELQNQNGPTRESDNSCDIPTRAKRTAQVPTARSRMVAPKRSRSPSEQDPHRAKNRRKKY